MRVGFIGLGNMGGPMARNIARSGFDLTVFDLDDAKVASVVEAGARPGADVAAVAREAEVMLTSLPGPPQVRAVGEVLIREMAPGAVWVDLSTNDLETARDLADLASDASIALVDAPVTGGAEGAAAGTLSVLCGGSAATFDQVRPVLDSIGDRVDLLGAHGAGYVAKIASVSLCYLHSVSLIEAMLLGVKGGVDPDKMLDVIQHSTGRSYVADRYGPEMLNGGYDDTFDLGLADKDLRLATDMAAALGARLPFLHDVAAFYADAVQRYGFDAPHLRAVQSIEVDNDLVLHRERGHDDHDTA